MATAVITRADLKQQALQAYALTEADQAGLAQAIYAQRLEARRAARNHAAQTVQAPVDDAWEPPAEALRQMADESLAHAADIAQTYHEDLEAHIESLMNEEADEPAHHLASGLLSWANDRAGWKSVQIGQYETHQAGNLGTRDALAGLAIRRTTADDSSGVDPAVFGLVVYPGTAAEPFCQRLAGHVYGVWEYEYLTRVLPAHQNCPHGVYIFPLGELS